ncbi:MAG: hypothetical protein AAFQ58_16375 [Pseudomonadota bacterium]
MSILRVGIFLLLSGPGTALAESRAVIPNVIAPSTEGARISVKVEPGLRSDKRLRSAALRQARADLHAGDPVMAPDLRALAEAGDGLAAQRYVRVLEASGTAAPSDLAYFAAVAVGTGRIWTLDTMVRAMHRLDPATEPKARINKYISVLYPHAWAGNPVALQAVVDFNGAGRLFGPLSERTRQRILDQARVQGDGRLELGLAVALLERSEAMARPDPDDLIQAQELLQRAEASDHLAVQTTAKNLLRRMSKATPEG